MNNKLSIVLAGLVLGIFIAGGQRGWFGQSKESFPKLPQAPDFPVTTEFDGYWSGKRINVTNNNLCERTTITGKVENGKAVFRLTYNGTGLQGWINEDGSLRLYASNRQWDYRFTGNAYKDAIKGDWHITNGPCKGTWFLERNNP